MKKQSALFVMSFLALSNANFKVEPTSNLKTESGFAKASPDKSPDTPKEDTKQTQECIEFSNLEKDLLNAFLEIKPRVTARIKNILKIIESVKKELETQKIQTTKGYEYKLTKEEIIQLKNKMLKPGKIFLKAIHKNQNMSKELVKQSLKNPSNSILVKFFDTRKNEIDTHFEKNINTAEDLEQVANDFTTFMKDVLYNMSDEAKKAYKDFVIKIKIKKQLEQAQNKK